MIEWVKFLFAFLSRPQNAGMSFALICLLGFGWFNLRQAADFSQERRLFLKQLSDKDSLMNRQREDYVVTIRELRRDVLECSRNIERLETEIKALKSKK